MKEKLQNISEIQFGSTFKSSINGTVPCLQVSNITVDGSIDRNQMVFVDDELSTTESLLNVVDILMPAKGQKFSSALIDTDLGRNAVASSSLFILRVLSDRVLPEYLHWYLNLPRTKWMLESVATGTNIISLSIKEVRDLAVEIPDLNTQRKIIELKKLQEEEFKKMYQLGDARKKLIEAVTKKLIEQ